MTDADALLAAIIENPDEDTPRLAYADEIQETDAERAEFIRVQVEIARRPRLDCGGVQCDRCQFPTGFHRYTKRCRGEVCRLRQREYYTSFRYVVWNWTRGIPPGAQPSFRRGFVEKIVLRADWWVAHGPHIVTRYPITEIRLSDREPELEPHGGQYRWWVPFPFPSPRSQRVPYRTAEEAREAVSADCLAWARAEAKAKSRAAAVVLTGAVK
jgi:uncharacterized protein (TIGR02996 family)